MLKEIDCTSSPPLPLDPGLESAGCGQSGTTSKKKSQIHSGSKTEKALFSQIADSFVNKHNYKIWNSAHNLLKSNEYGDQATYKEGP